MTDEQPRAVRKENDAIETMEKMVDGFTAYVETSESRARKGRRYRDHLLWVHCLFGMAMSPTFANLKTENAITNQWAALRQLPGSPVSIAAIIGIGAFILGLSLIAEYRIGEIIGLAMLATFYLVVAVGFAMAVIYAARGELTGPPPPVYPPVFYLHMSIIMTVHMGTLIRRRSRDNELSL